MIVYTKVHSPNIIANNYKGARRLSARLFFLLPVIRFCTVFAQVVFI